MSRVFEILKETLEEDEPVNEDMSSMLATLKSKRNKQATMKIFNEVEKETFQYMWDRFLIQQRSYKQRKKTKFVKYNSVFFNELMETLELDKSTVNRLKNDFKDKLRKLNEIYKGYGTPQGKSDEEVKQELKKNRVDINGLYNKIIKYASFYSVEKYFRENDVPSLVKQSMQNSSNNSANNVDGLIKKIKSGNKNKSSREGFLKGAKDALEKRMSQ